MTQPAETFPVSIESAWKRLMVTLATDNVGRAKQMTLAQKGVKRIMVRR